MIASSRRDFTYTEEVICPVGGQPIKILRAHKVPRVRDEIIKSIFYLYPSVEAAEAGEESGGTGFLVAVRSEAHPDCSDMYAVSNQHVVHAPGYAPVIRINHASRVPLSMTIVGNREIIPLAVNQWKAHPDGDDLAVAPLGRVDGRRYRFPRCLPHDLLLSYEVMEAFDIGPGDDVYMVGRFIHHAGEHFNTPSVRSGIISMMPSLVQFEEGGFEQEAFLVEMRSISGYSGSPVYWHLPFTHPAFWPLEREMKPEAHQMTAGPWLVGVDCGNFKYFNPVYEVRKEAGQTKRYKTKEPKLEAKSHAGQAIVIPAWRLKTLLDVEELEMARKEEDRRMTEAQENSPVDRDVAAPQEDQPLTQEAFEEALRRSSRKIPPPEEEK